MTTSQIENRIAELNSLILESLKDMSVQGAVRWAKLQDERSALRNMLCR